MALFILGSCINISVSQTVDLSSVDAFFEVTATLKEGKEISATQWKDFDSSICYKTYANRKDKTGINLIKNTIHLVFGNGNSAEKDSILSITKDEMDRNPMLMKKKLLLTNYLDINNKYESIKTFRENYDFNALVEKAKQRLSSFLGISIDSITKLKPVYFLFLIADGKNNEEAIYLDLNLIYRKTEEQRVDFLAHEFFHNFRERYENHAFNYKNGLNHCIDLIQNEGIADMIDKSEGYEKYFTDAGELPEMVEIWVNLYKRAETDLEKFNNLIVKYSKKEISDKEMADEILEIVKFNGHAIGFFMATHIVSAGFKSELLASFYNPYTFFVLYKKAAKEQHLFQLSDDFMNFFKDITKENYR